MVRKRIIYDESNYVTGHSRQFKQKLRFCNGSPLGNPGHDCQVFKAEVLGSGHIYAVKMYKAYSSQQMALDRDRLQRKGYELSDKALENYFHPWHRESRAYEHMDRHIVYPARRFFPEYYGTALIPFSSCPAYWQQTMPFEGQVPVIVLEFLEGPRSDREPRYLDITEQTLSTANKLYSQLGDGCAHTFIHLIEMVETLHSANIIHGDVKSDAFVDYAITGGLAMYDFSLSWVSVHGLPCLDPFHREPRSFGERSSGERRAVEWLVTTDHVAVQKKVLSLQECEGCVKAMDKVRNGS